MKITPRATATTNANPVKRMSEAERQRGMKEMTEAFRQNGGPSIWT